MPGTVDVRPKRHGNKLTLEFKQERAGAEPVKFEAFRMSDGTLRVLGLITAVFQRPTPSLVVIEEPEASIHPGALGSILDLLRLARESMQVVVRDLGTGGGRRGVLAVKVLPSCEGLRDR